MLPDTPRPQMAQRHFDVADVLEQHLPRSVDNSLPYGYHAVAGVLLARVAGLTRSVGHLIAAGRDLDARMLMRSAVEHVTLLGWLTIDVSELPADRRGARDWEASDRETNTLWWTAGQMRAMRDHAGRVTVALDTDLDAAARAGLRAMKEVIDRGWKGGLPNIETMATEADAAWGGRIAGWPPPHALAAGDAMGLHRMYWVLYKAGNASAHPQIAELVGRFLDRPVGTGGSAAVVPERVGENVDVHVGITAFLPVFAAGLFAVVHGPQVLRDTLVAMDRYDAVVGPTLLLQSVDGLVGDPDGRRDGISGEWAISVRRQGDDRTIVLAAQGSWARLTHRPGPVWTSDDNAHGPISRRANELDDSFVTVLSRFRTAVDAADWKTAPRWPSVAP